ncbi:MAG: hypothetical protein HQL82_10035 [Magnetococcales bacterium]|nr:hypothetical protein [Magnetococcales bacterium]
MASRSPPVVATPPGWVGILLLILPLLLAGVLWQEGQDYDPGLLDFRRPAAAAGAALLPPGLGPLERLGAVRSYDRNTLYEYINGHAEFFIGAGFQGLAVGDYARTGAAQPVLTVDLYDLGQPLHAFGVLMEEAAAGAEAVAVGAMGFRQDRTLAFISGPYYVRLAAFEPDLALEEVARSLAGSMPAPGPGANGLPEFPDLGLTVTGIRFVKEGYRGLAFLNNVLERRLGGAESDITLFAPTGTAAELAPLRERLEAFLAGEGFQYRVETVGEFRDYRIQDPYEGDWALWLGPTRALGAFGSLSAERLAQLRRAVTGHD